MIYEAAIEQQDTFKKSLLPVLLGTVLIGVNVAGDAFAVHWDLPIWLDTFGTMIAGYFLGPVAGGIVGFCSHLLICLKDQSNTWMYAFANMLIGMLVAERKRQGKLKDLFGFCNTAMLLALTSMVVSIPNTIFLRNSTMGNRWGNDIIRVMEALQVPSVLAVILGEFYVDFVDKLILMYALYFCIRQYRWLRYQERTRISAMDIVNFMLLPIMITEVVIRSVFRGNFAESQYFRNYIIAVLLLLFCWVNWFLSAALQRRELLKQKDKVQVLQEKNSMIKGTILTIAHMVDAKDIYTARHSERVTRYSLLIGEQLGFSASEMKNLERAAILHDIGKVGIPDGILRKKGKLSNAEFETMKTHPVIGGEILKDFDFAPQISEGAMYHHERYDGKGYPDGLKGEEIPLFGRIIAIADSYDAMSSNRIYRPKCDPDYIYRELKENRGIQFDPKLCDIFLGLLDAGKLDDPAEDNGRMTLQKAYERFGGRYELAQRRMKTDANIMLLLTHFLDEIEFTHLKEALEQGDDRAAFHAVHTLKGIALNLGIETLAESCISLTENLRNAPINAQTAELFDQVERTYQEVQAVIRELQQ